MRLFPRLIALALLLATLAAPLPSLAQATTNVNSTAFPLSSNIMFPSRPNRSALRCQNATTNAAATVTYDGFSVVLQPGGSLWEIGVNNANNAGRVPTGVITATGTSTQVLNCREDY